MRKFNTGVKTTMKNLYFVITNIPKIFKFLQEAIEEKIEKDYEKIKVELLKGKTNDKS